MQSNKESSRRGLKRGLVLVHRFFGLVLGLHIALLCLTGSILIYGEEIDNLLNPGLRATTGSGRMISIPEVIETYRRNRPGIEIDRVYAPQGGLHVYRIRTYPTNRQREAFVDPYSGRFLGERFRDSFFIRQLGHYHISLLHVVGGRNINGFTAIVGLYLIYSGLLFWRPKSWAQFRNRISIKSGGSVQRKVVDLHLAAGFWAAPILICALSSGVLWAFEDFTNVSLTLIGGDPRFEERPKVASTGAPLHKDADLIGLATSHGHEAHMVKYLLPTTKNRVAEIHQEWSDNDNYGNKLVTFLNGETGELIREHDTRTGSFGTWISKWIRPFHRGLWGGSVTRVLYCMAGLAPLILFYTGVRKRSFRAAANAKLRAKRVEPLEADLEAVPSEQVEVTV